VNTNKWKVQLHCTKSLANVTVMSKERKRTGTEGSEVQTHVLLYVFGYNTGNQVSQRKMEYII